MGYLKNPKSSFPLVESVPRIVIRTEVFGKTFSANRAMEHPAQGHSIHVAAVDAEPNDASRELVHYNDNPMGLQNDGFASE